MLKDEAKRKITIFRKEIEKFLGIFVLLFLTAIIVINWGTIKGMFNYRAIYSEMYEEISKSLADFFSEEKEIALKVPQIRLSEPKFEFSDKPDSIEIPKIGVIAPLIFPETSAKNELDRLLNQGVIFYPDSVLPGQEGMTVVLGHSAPSGWPKINYDWVFSRLNELEEGDEVFVYYNHRKYPYLVKEKIFLKKGDDIPASDSVESDSILTMLSCWPPGIDNKRIAVQAELQF